MNGMSQFLSEAMNEVADELIEGVDLQVDLKNYKRADNTKTKTDIGVSMSKDLNSRLTVTIGKNFTLGEDHTSYQNNMQQYMPDITTTYKLSKDGRYRVKAYNKNEYDTVVEGYFTETGASRHAIHTPPTLASTSSHVQPRFRVSRPARSDNSAAPGVQDARMFGWSTRNWMQSFA
jgi:hypothetical protein